MKIGHPPVGVLVSDGSYGQVAEILDELHGNIGSAFSRPQQMTPHIRPVQLHAVHHVVGDGRRNRPDHGGVGSVEGTDEAGPVPREPPPQRGHRKSGYLEENRVRRRQRLLERPQGAQLPEPSSHPHSQMVEVGTGHRGVRRDPRGGARFAYRLPAQHRAPVVSEEVNGFVGAHRIDHREQVGREMCQTVVRDTAGNGGGPRAAVVEPDDAEFVGQVRHDPVPQGMGVGPAVHEDQCRTVGVSFFDGVKADRSVGDGTCAHVVPQRSSTRRPSARETQTSISSRRSSSVRRLSRWSGLPDRTRVRHVPQNPCRQE